MKRSVIIAVILAVIIIAGFLGDRLITAKKSLAARKPQYTTATATIGAIESKVSASGTVEPLNRDTLKTESRDTVDSVKVKENSIVKKDDELITFQYGSAAIAAPYDGIVSEVDVKSGDQVNAGQDAVKIFDNRNFLTKISVDELDLPSIKLGQKAQITVNAYPGKAFTGTVTDIGQEGTSSNGVSSFPVTVTFNEIDDIKAGMTTEATIITASKDKALLVPIEAVASVNGERTVMLVNADGTSQTRKVEIGISSNTMVEITNGLSEGDRVKLPQTTASQQTNTLRIPGASKLQGGQGGNNADGGQSPAQTQ